MSPAKTAGHDKLHLGRKSIVADHASIDFEFLQELAMMINRIPMLMFCDVQTAEPRKAVQQATAKKMRQTDVAAEVKRLANSGSGRRSSATGCLMHA